MTQSSPRLWSALAALAVSLPTFAQAPAAPAPAAPAAAVVPAPPPTPADVDRQRAAQVSTLKLLRDKNVITEEEYQAALRDLGELGVRAKDSNTFVLGKLSTTVYGFVQADFIHSSTQSFGADFAGNGQVARPGTYAGEHDRLVFTIRDSRLGFRLSASVPSGYGATAVFEGDFLGSEPGIFQASGGTAPTPGSTNSEGGFLGNPTFRVRHAFLKAETPLVDVLVGQTWNVLGWQPVFVPVVVQWPGLSGELFSRSTQLRLTKTFKSDFLTVEVAAAALRPAQRDSGLPNGEAGIRLALNKWAGVHTSYLTATSALPLTVAITGDVRAFRIPQFAAGAPSDAVNNLTGGAFAVDAYIPIIPGTPASRGNTLSLTAEFARGAGIGDQYTAFSSGVNNPALPADAVTGISPAFATHVDPGMAAYDSTGALHLVQTQTFFANLEYYLPVLEGKIGVFGGYYQTDILNVDDFTSSPAAMRRRASLFEAGALFDPVPAVRLAADVAAVRDVYKDGVQAWNWNVQTSAFFFF